MPTEPGRQTLLRAIYNGHYVSLMNLPSFHDDEFAVTAIVSRFGDQFAFASDRLKDSQYVSEAAITNYAGAYTHCSDRLKADKAFAMAMVSLNPDVFVLIDAQFRDDIEVAVAVVREYGLLLRHCSGRMRDNRNVVMEAVMENAHAIEFASIRNRQSYTVMHAAVRKDGMILRVCEAAGFSKRLLLTAVKCDPEAYQFAMGSARDDPKVMAAAIEGDPCNFLLLPSRVRRDWEFALWATTMHPSIASELPACLESNHDFTVQMVEGNPATYGFLAKRWRPSPALAVVRQVGLRRLRFLARAYERYRAEDDQYSRETLHPSAVAREATLSDDWHESSAFEMPEFLATVIARRKLPWAAT